MDFLCDTILLRIERRIDMRKNKNLLAFGLAMTVVFSACQNSPDSSIVKNKDFDNMIDEAQNTEGGFKSVTDVAKNYDNYQTTIDDESLKVSVNVDAKVDIPGTGQMSVMRVKQKKMDQDFLNKVKEVLVQDETLYDGSVKEMKTRGMIEQEIQMLRQQLDEFPDMKDETQRMIDELQAEYESTKDEIEYADYPSDGLLHSVAELYEKDKQNDFYSWEYSLNASGDVYYGVSDGKNGKYTALYVQNNEDYGNCLRYDSDSHGDMKISQVVVGETSDLGRWKIGEEDPKDHLLVEGGETENYLQEYTDMPTTITQEEAQAKAGELLRSLGLDNFECSEGGLYGQACGVLDGGEKTGYRKVYIFKYLRNIDGVFVDNEGGSKFTDGWQGDDYVKREWAGENIEVVVNDSGIVGFYYNSPVEITETVVDKSSMKSFDEIKQIFEQMVTVANARGEGKDEEDRVSIDVHSVVLRYTRISEADSFDTGLLVPVWDFIGKRTDAYGEKEAVDQNACIMTINAIDGSIIDRTLGY